MGKRPTSLSAALRRQFSLIGQGQVPQPYAQWVPRGAVPKGQFTVESVPALGSHGMTNQADRTIRLRPDATRDDFRHELGHEFDFTVMTPAARAGFQKIMGLRGPWLAPDGGTPTQGSVDVPGEQFAEAYRAYSNNPRRVGTQPLYYGYNPSARQYRRVGALLNRAYRRSLAG